MLFAAVDSTLLVLLAEICLAAASYSLATALLAPAYGREYPITALGPKIAATVAAALAATLVTRLYRRPLRHSSALDVIVLLETVAISCAATGIFVRWFVPPLQIHLAALVVYAAFLTIFWGGLHFGARMWQLRRSAAQKHAKRVVIVGAGEAGLSVAKELTLGQSANCRPVALVDDNNQKWGRAFYGVRVVGGTKDLAQVAQATGAEEILICIPSANHAQMHDILDASRRSQLPVRSLPSLAEWIQGTAAEPVSARDLCSPRIKYLLQREEIRVDAEETRALVGGQTVLVTGAGGSIGSELCRQIAVANPRKLLLLDKSENGLFYVNLESCERMESARVKPFLADVLVADNLRQIVMAERPDIVFHAAAHKHVAMLELYPQEAIRNNVLGTRNIARAAIECNASRFVNISTDKAVAPTNYMGLSKKLTELCIQELADGRGERHTRFANVRFGNVAGSTGSVLRLFWDQIRKGGPVRVTDPHASRYFMSAPEAVHLILRAATLGRNGETFVLDMGDPLNIYDLAKTMILFAGLRPERDIPIELTGLRAGEKITEALWEDWEHPVASSSARILTIEQKSLRSRGIVSKIDWMEDLLSRGDHEELVRYLHELFPEFRASAAGETLQAQPAEETLRPRAGAA